LASRLQWPCPPQQPDQTATGSASSRRFVHFMVSENVRDDDYNLVFNDGVDPEGDWQAHLILPPVALG